MFTVKLVTELIFLLATLALSNLSCFSCTDNVQNERTLRYNTSVKNSAVGPSYTYSVEGLRSLIFLEKDLFFIIKDYIAELDNEPEYYFLRYIADYEESSLIAFNDRKRIEENRPLAIISNPLWSYRMIWRFVTDLPKINNYLSTNAESEILKEFQNKIPPKFIWPSERDLNNAMDNLLNTHFVYDLNLTEFTNGIIGNIATNASLAGIHCFEISKYALKNNGQFTMALEWLEIADTKRIDIKKHPILDDVEPSSISRLLKQIIKNHDLVWKEPAGDADMYQYLYKMSSKYRWIPQKIALQQKNKNKGDAAPYPSLNDVTAFSALCKGVNLQSEKEKSELYCWYESQMNPVWYINPQKMELHSKEPYIFQVHNFIEHELMEYLKQEAAPALERSKVISLRHNHSTTAQQAAQRELEKKYSKGRTSMYSWLSEYQYKPRLPSLSQKISYLTGLTASWGKINASSSFQIAVYTTGGYFDVHEDPVKDSTNEKGWDEIGNRIATFMIYLSNVEVGGATAFTSAGVAVPPIKGSAVFWYNLKRNGQVDHRTWHGGCPVLIGEKWVANKWIHNNFNILKRQCTLNEDD